MIALIINEIWETIVLFKDVNIVINKWIFKIKMYINDTLNKFKTRLVIKKIFQMYDIDYTNTFVSIVKFDILRLFLIIITLKDLKFYQMNVNNVFIKLFLKKVIYMKSLSNVKLSSDQALFIRRNFYDLKQVVKNWYERCVHELRKFEFKQISANSCMLRNKEQNIIFFYMSTISSSLSNSRNKCNDLRTSFKRYLKSRIWKRWKKFLILKLFVIASDAQYA